MYSEFKKVNNRIPSAKYPMSIKSDLKKLYYDKAITAGNGSSFQI